MSIKEDTCSTTVGAFISSVVEAAKIARVVCTQLCVIHREERGSVAVKDKGLGHFSDWFGRVDLCYEVDLEPVNFHSVLSYQLSV